MEGRGGESSWNAAQMLTARGRGVTCWFILLFRIVLDEPGIKQMQHTDSTFSVSETYLLTSVLCSQWW